MPALARSQRKGQRLFGWYLERTSGQMRALEHRPDGSLWSPHLESFLVPDGAYLRLYDRQGQLRLTEAEAEAEARKSAMRLAEAEAHRAEAEAEKARAFAEKLRSLGIDPEQLI